MACRGCAILLVLLPLLAASAVWGDENKEVVHWAQGLHPPYSTAGAAVACQSLRETQEKPQCDTTRTDFSQTSPSQFKLQTRQSAIQAASRGLIQYGKQCMVETRSLAAMTLPLTGRNPADSTRTSTSHSFSGWKGSMRWLTPPNYASGKQVLSVQKIRAVMKAMGAGITTDVQNAAFHEPAQNTLVLAYTLNTTSMKVWSTQQAAGTTESRATCNRETWQAHQRADAQAIWLAMAPGVLEYTPLRWEQMLQLPGARAHTRPGDQQKKTLHSHL